MIPNLLPNATKIEQITLSLEISSEAPGVNSDWPSDISFYLNDVKIGTSDNLGLRRCAGFLHQYWCFRIGINMVF